MNLSWQGNGKRVSMSSTVHYIDPNVSSIATETNRRQKEVLEQVQHSPTRAPTELQHVSKDQMKQCKLQYSHENIAILTQLLQYSHEIIHISLVKRPQTNL